MKTVVIYHNPRCSKSREALRLLQDAPVAVEIVEYLKTPPERATLERILDLLGGEPGALVRAKDPAFAAAGYGPENLSGREAVVNLLLAHPALMERPIVVVGSRAVIGRPPERVSALIS
jgi:arsenate reductase